MNTGVKNLIEKRAWRYTYVVPYIKKYKHMELGNKKVLLEGIKTFRHITAIRVNTLTKPMGSAYSRLFKKVKIDLCKGNRFIYFIDKDVTFAVPGKIISNFTLDYSRIIDGSINDLYVKGSEEASSSMNLTVDALKEFLNRICDAIRDSDMEETEKKTKLYYFQRMYLNKAETFQEGLQRILFFLQLLWQTGHRLNGIGRLDYILNNLYQKDIAEDRINKEDALLMIMDFINTIHKEYWYISDSLAGDTGEIIILGGLNQDGTYFYNDITLFALEAITKLRIPEPKILLRVSKKMPGTLMEAALNCLKAATGSPLFSNDDVVIPLLMDFGFRREDAYNYVTSACWEPYITGQAMDQNNIACFSFHEPFDEVMRNTDLKELKTIEELIGKYEDKLKSYTTNFLQGLNEFQWAKDPLVSLFIETCRQNGTDIADGGARYNNYGVTSVGMANVVDSLMNLQKVVFMEHRLTLYELEAARQGNYEKMEESYLILKNSTKSYGRDSDEVIALVNRLFRTVNDTLRDYKNKYGGKVKIGLSSPSYIMLSKGASAGFDGRKEGTPFQVHISCMGVAYTELVQFASRLDYSSHRFNGNVVDFFVAPDFIDRNFEKFKDFMMISIKLGFFQMQMNVMDSKTLIDAQMNPDNYRSLIVRVWGFSAYFNDLPKSYQDVLIERAIKSEVA